MVEQVRRLRRDSQSRPGRPRVIVRANYVGLPSMAGRGTDESGESRRISGRKPCPVPGSTVPKPKIAAVERREARWADRKAHAAPRKRGTVMRLLAAPLPLGDQERDRQTRRLTKHGPAERWLALSSSPDLIRRSIFFTKRWTHRNSDLSEFRTISAHIG